MSKHFVLLCLSPFDTEYYQFDIPYSIVCNRWNEGILFSDNDEREGFHPPIEPIEIQTEPETDLYPRVYAELYWNPIPLMTRRLVNALYAAGVDNLQTYDTKLISTQGDNPPPHNHYLAVNIVGHMKAVDFENSEINQDVSERLISMDFFSFAIDEMKTKNLLMFRLVENVSAVLVHERVKAAIEVTGITTLTWLAPEEWAG